MLSFQLSRRRIALWLAVFMCGVLAALPLVGRAAPPQTQPASDLPKAETILDRYVDVTGGKAAYEKCKNRVSRGTLEVPAANLKGTVTIYHAAPDKMYSVTEIPGIGPVLEGCNGEVAWEHNPMMGPRLKEGSEKATALREAVFNAELNWRKIFKKAETVALEDVNGKPAYKVELTPAEGNAEIRHYDKESGLLVKSTFALSTKMGDIPVEIVLSDYKETGGIKVPQKATQTVAGQTVVLTFESVEHNAELPADRFDLPPEVKALLDKPKAPETQGAGPSSKEKEPKKP